MEELNMIVTIITTKDRNLTQGLLDEDNTLLTFEGEEDARQFLEDNNLAHINYAFAEITVNSLPRTYGYYDY
tara:strand:- start:414 stop:629 length:216 start_codon:yes stop_codon:yes gene_type:complete